MVYERSPDEYICEIHSEYIPQTHHSHNYSIRLCTNILYTICVVGFYIPLTEDIDTCSQEWAPATYS